MQETMQDAAQVAKPSAGRGDKATIKKFRATMGLFLLLSYAGMLLNMIPVLSLVHYSGVFAPVFAGAAAIFYALMYLMPGYLLAGLLEWALRRAVGKWVGLRVRLAVAYAAGVLLFFAAQVLVFADARVFGMYKFHVYDGYVWNLLTTRGGLDSMEMDRQAYILFAAMIASLLLGEITLLLVALKAKWLRSRLLPVLAVRRTSVIVLVVTALLGLSQLLTYAASKFKGYTPVLAAAEPVPLFQELSVRSLGKMLGLKPVEGDLRIKAEFSSLQYPLHPLNIVPPEHPYNVVMLVSESWRADMVDKEIMPHVYDFAQKSSWFRQHYSGGHDTRMALFGLMYGLYGPYWFPFMDSTRGPALVDTLLQEKYEMHVYSSMDFTYPEFDRTLFAAIPANQLHTLISMGGRVGKGSASRGGDDDAPNNIAAGDANDQNANWRRDRVNVDQILSSLDQRDTSKPFFVWMFFDTPHAPYYFPPSAVIRTPYRETLNYATLKLPQDAPLLKNRYINSVHELDSQMNRVLEYLDRNGLMDSTIVVLCGDHGEEFCEKGHWGHASGYPEEQTRTPMIIHVPGRAAEQITRMSSHLDIPATLMHVLGVTNPPSDYSFGHDLFGTEVRTSTVISGWKDLGYVDEQYKTIIPTKGITSQKVTTRDDVRVDDVAGYNRAHQRELQEVLRQLGAFRK